MYITRQIQTANGQIRVWVEVEPGEERMLKVPEEATEDEILAEADRLIAAENKALNLIAAADRDAEIASLLARLSELRGA